jgi:hypothetical protein
VDRGRQRDLLRCPEIRRYDARPTVLRDIAENDPMMREGVTMKGQTIARRGIAWAVVTWVLVGGTIVGLAGEAALDTATIERLTGAKGELNEQEGVFKVTVPRTDLDVSAAGVKLLPPMGLTSWAAFQKAGDRTMVMGDLVMLEDQVNPVMSVALENGLEVTALHNHFSWDAPKVMFMHIGGLGDEAKLAAEVGKAFQNQGDEWRQAGGAAGQTQPRPDVLRSQHRPRVEGCTCYPTPITFAGHGDGRRSVRAGRRRRGCQSQRERSGSQHVPGPEGWTSGRGGPPRLRVTRLRRCRRSEIDEGYIRDAAPHAGHRLLRLCAASPVSARSDRCCIDIS